jgi:serine protease AprX
MRKHLSSFFLLFMVCMSLTSYGQRGYAQQKYWVSFKTKTAKSFDPYSFFDAKTIENRKNSGQPITDWYDLPVDAGYIKTVSNIADSSGYSSRWLNGMAVYAGSEKIAQIAALPFVSGAEPMKVYGMATSTAKKTKPDSSDKEDKVCEQIAGLEGEQLAYHGLTGKGIRIAVLDVGFVNADKHPAFKYLRDHNGIILTHDFLNKKENVYNYGAHGTAVLSCIAGKYEGYNMGMAPDAEFLLARTERDGSEFIDEEDAWVAASEWAEQHGAQMISCSLGYTYQRYFYRDMNGRTSIVARGATAAAHKGLLICIAAGNDGNANWKFISTPADADSVLTVGGYDPATRYRINFSSVGPTSDNRIKPNIIAAGTAWVATPKNYGNESGTSFATPLMAGFVACVWQKMHGKTNMEILHYVETLGSLYPYYDFAHGYGIPKAGNLFHKHASNDSAFTLSQAENKIMVSIAPSYFNDSFQVENKLKNKYVYAKITDPKGIVRIYNVVKVENQRIELANLTKYLLEDRIGEKGLDDVGQGEGSYPKDWLVTVYFDDCIRTYKY